MAFSKFGKSEIIHTVYVKDAETEVKTPIKTQPDKESEDK